ncbi:thiamine biosynthesis lipoprotein [Geothermobacter ehrlichii]|uniref:FAD:protein FMN transferase n=2 Tax=Geothermobacter ehrlichii TaxID=213224 RepID=A0A5D3WH55_9BACT|nr:thiamine biosynthesis lipoprotein [Geothermobacter ehrlichii]
MRVRRFSACLLLLVLVLLLTAGCRDRRPEPVRRTRMLMGTIVEVVAFGDRKPTLAAIDRALDEMARIEELMSPRRPGSDLARLAAARDFVTLSPETARLLRLSLAINRRSGGAFDPTLGALKRLWDIEGEHPAVPDEAALRRALALTGPDRLLLDGDRARVAAPGVGVDLGGIAKGYAIDRAAAVLRQAGITHASINAGGDLRLIGDRFGRPWRIGIQHPRRQGEMLAILELEDAAVVTSGDYERYFMADGKRYHHIFDPATGRPARGCQSVTVVAGDAVRADALATAAFVLGPKRGLELLRREGVEGVLVAADGRTLVTEGLKGRIQWR